jgi:hypothetical protein
MSGPDDARKPDVARVLAGLKDFQRTTVDYVFRRLYQDADATRRFLVADEVGLGKTLVARGVVARAVDHLWGRVPRIDIVYICSNASIARQNISRLRIGDEQGYTLPSRITLLPHSVRALASNPINFISFTPGTSFDLHSRLGTVEERALLYLLLKDEWGLAGSGPAGVLRGNASADTFWSWADWLAAHREIDAELARRFHHALAQRAAHGESDGQPDVRARFDALRVRFRLADGPRTPQDRHDQAAVVSELRALLARTCLDALEPDLIILDEFQRFKHLLDGEDEASQLARALFEYSDEHTQTRVLLLSATPYKMYTLADEAHGDDHFADFRRTVRFLSPDADPAAFERLLADYGDALFRLGDEGPEGPGRLSAARDALQDALRRVMVRTERLAVTADRDGMLVQVPAATDTLHADDVASYLALQRVAGLLEQPDALEYWKSAPYLFSFMEGYRLKQAFDETLRHRTRAGHLTALLADDAGEAGGGGLLLSWSDLVRYQAVDPANARLRALQADTIGRGAWRLLWVPPSLPYYRPAGPFAEPDLQRLTKRLVFSSWHVVPKAVAALLSYAAEREMATSALGPDAANTPEARGRRGGLLRFARTDGRLTGMSVLALLYPSLTLALECDPLALAREAEPGGGPPTYAAVHALATRRIERLLADLPADLPGGTRDLADDPYWYWAAPILLDRFRDPRATEAWLLHPDAAVRWSGTPLARRGPRRPDARAPAEGVGDNTHWAEHVERVRELLQGRVPLGQPPPDLAPTLARMALASPAVCALRALCRHDGGRDTLGVPEVQDSAAQVAWASRSLFNLPDVTALLRAPGGSDDRLDAGGSEAYWRRVLDYAAEGCLQAVLDEYAHVLRGALGLVDAPPVDAAVQVAGAMCRALTLRTSTLTADAVEPSEGPVQVGRYRLRTRFALRYGHQETETGLVLIRDDQVQEAFNSPFWPFVLVTTSIGQEGLDFHPYCHAVVHWNLPANPVDLEQREGRVHRFKGHAVRRNLADRYGDGALRGATDDRDVWDTLFTSGARDRPPDATDLVPYWVYATEGGARIERHVPCLPLSRDAARRDALRRSLAVYRMVFGQPRQEDLVDYLLTRVQPEELARAVDELRIDLSPPGALPGPD